LRLRALARKKKNSQIEGKIASKGAETQRRRKLEKGKLAPCFLIYKLSL